MINNLMPSTNYYLRIVAGNLIGLSQYSNITQFKTSGIFLFFYYSFFILFLSFLLFFNIFSCSFFSFFFLLIIIEGVPAAPNVIMREYDRDYILIDWNVTFDGDSNIVSFELSFSHDNHSWSSLPLSSNSSSYPSSFFLFLRSYLF